MRKLCRVQDVPRRGLTLMEILVGTAVCLFAVWLFVAYVVHHSRPKGRRLECQSNLKNLALAVSGYASANSGRIPDLVTLHGVPGTSGQSTYSWVAELLPHLDNSALYRWINSASAPPFSTSVPVPFIKVFICPNDQSRSSQPGGLSYVANAGYMRESDWGNNAGHHGLRIDWDRSGTTDEADLIIARSTGLFWRRDSHPAIGGDNGDPITLEFVAESDGQSQTMMLSENLQANTWLSTNTGEIAFGIFVTVGDSDQPDAIKFPATHGASGSDRLAFDVSRFNLMNAKKTRDASPGSLLDTRLGEAPRPSSPHQGIVNVAFADGRVEEVNIRMAPRIWAAMMTPNGQRNGQPAALDKP